MSRARSVQRWCGSSSLAAIIFAFGLLTVAARAQTPPEVRLAVTNGAWHLVWTPFPAVEIYRVRHATEAVGPWTPIDLEATGHLQCTIPESLLDGIFQIEAVPLGTDDLLAATVLSRLTYGPTPDELDRIRSSGPAAYVAEQLAPESISENLTHDRVSPATGWRYISVTGTSSSSTLYLYLTNPGEGFIDDIKLVAGSNAGVGSNLIRNGDFESPLTTNDWVIEENHAGSALTTAVKNSGAAALHLTADEGGTTRDSSIWQTIRPALTSGRTYTLSYWWLPSSNSPAAVTARLSGSGITSTPGTVRDRLEGGFATLADLRAWHSLNAVYSRRQLLEVMLQFLDNHFVTQHSKSADYFDGQYSNDGEDLIATRLEFKELQRWRSALLNPACTFHDLLKISAESPNMIIYLDTVENRGSNGRIANENYARELLELFACGVDNGYDQRDIEEMARVWTGWSVRFVRPDQERNPFAQRSDLLRPGAPAGSTDVTDLIGVWSFVFKDYNHDTRPKYLFYEWDANGDRGGPKTYPARFGPKYAGRPYSLTVPGRTGNNGVQEGYQVLTYLADLPFTQEFISVKLCRLFVHDDFRHGYDFADPNLSPEGRLVKSCMDAWESTAPKGQIRVVLKTIFDSELFRSHGGAQHKVKTPLEFAVGAIRTLLARNPGGADTAVTDGYSLRNPMRRAGNMDLFNRMDPDGFAEDAPPWISAGTLAERLRFVQGLLMPANYSARTDVAGASSADPVALVHLKLPAAQWKDAGAVADYFVGLLFPAEGKANLAGYQELAAGFLNTADNGAAPSPFAGLSTSGNPSAYETRLRGMVAFLMTLPRFQEQ